MSRCLSRADAVAHALYSPFMAGRRIAAARWYHRIHLIPGRLLAVVCDRHERGVWASFPEPCGWTCEHFTISAVPASAVGRLVVSCGCEMQPYYPTTVAGVTAS